MAGHMVNLCYVTYTSMNSRTCSLFYITTLTLAWWCHQVETFSALLAICAGNSPVPGEFHAQRPVTRSFDVFFDLRLNKRLSKQSWGWWFETLSRPLWCHCNGCVSKLSHCWFSQLLHAYWAQATPWTEANVFIIWTLQEQISMYF